MLTLFCQEGPVKDYDDAVRSDDIVPQPGGQSRQEIPIMPRAEILEACNAEVINRGRIGTR